MEDENNKIFVGGVSQQTWEETLKQHFNKYGKITKSEVIKNRFTGCNRGFGFVTFADSSSLDEALKDKHAILGRPVEVKRARPKGNKDEEVNSENNNSVNGRIHHDNVVNKIFVGGLPPILTQQEFRSYFENFGTVTDAVIIQDQENRPRGFGFVSFESEEVVKIVLENEFHILQDKKVQVKKARPKEINNHLKLFRVYDAYNNGLGFVAGDINNNNTVRGQYYNNNMLHNGFYYGLNFPGTWPYGQYYPYVYPSNYSHFIGHNTTLANGHNSGFVSNNGGNANGAGTTTTTTTTTALHLENGDGVVNNISHQINDTTTVIEENGLDGESTSSNSQTIECLNLEICSMKNNGQTEERVEDYPSEQLSKMEALILDDDDVETQKDIDAQHSS